MRYWDQDGLPELMLGLLLTITGSAFLAGYALPRESSIAQVYAFVAPIVWGGSSLAMSWGLRKLKERITFPRGGYVALRRPTPAYRVSALVVVLLVGGWMFLLRDGLTRGQSVVAPGVAAFFVVALLVGGLRYRLPHMLGLAAFSLLLGAGAYRINAGSQGALSVMVFLGVAMVLTGALRLRNFLKAFPRPANTEA